MLFKKTSNKKMCKIPLDINTKIMYVVYVMNN